MVATQDLVANQELYGSHTELHGSHTSCMVVTQQCSHHTLCMLVLCMVATHECPLHMLILHTLITVYGSCM